MKIADVQALPLAVPIKEKGPRSPRASRLGRQLVVKVISDEGLTGVGEASISRCPPDAICLIIEKGLKPHLIGENPSQIEKLMEKLYRQTSPYTRQGLGLYAISGIEIALWDLVGKIRGLPVVDLLGGPCVPKVKAYASLLRYDRPEEVAEVSQSYVAQGFTAVKLHQTDVESVRAVRKALGDDIDLMIDVNCAWSPLEAIRKAREFGEYNLRWIEEPVWPPEDHEGLAKVSAASVTPISAGENEATRFGFRGLIAQRSVDILQPSLCKVGGIWEAKKICNLGSSWNLPVIPCVFVLGAGLSATVHLLASTPETLFLEFPAVELEEEFLFNPHRPDNGFVEVSIRPGLGVELNEAVAKHYLYSSD